MEKEFIDKYEKLLNNEDHFSIHKEDLLNLVDLRKLESKESYKHLEELGGVECLLERLDVNPLTGLCDDEDHTSFDIRKKTFGTNKALLPPTHTFLQCLLEVFKDKIIIFLLFAATVRLLIDIFEKKGKWFDYCSIYIVVIVISLIVAATNYYKEKVFANFAIEIDYKEVRVLRNQIEKLIPKTELMVGDILIVNAGDILPVDGIIIKAYSISVEANDKICKYHNVHFRHTLLSTRFNEKQIKSNKPDEFPIVLSGSKIVRGYAYVLVLCVGHETYLNRKNITQYKKRRSRISPSKSFIKDKMAKKETEDVMNGAFNVNTPTSVQNSISNENLFKIDFKKKEDLLSPNKLNETKNYQLTPSPQVNYLKNQKTENTIKISEDNFIEVEKEVMQQNKKIIPEDEENYPLISFDEESTFTPLQHKLQEISYILSKFGIIASLIAMSFFVGTYFIVPHHFLQSPDLLQVIFDAILYGIVLTVVAVPEGLPLLVTLSMAFSLQKMREQKTIIKNLEACENMACVDCICTDFTGILTKNDMRVTSIFIEDQLIEGRNVSQLRDFVSSDLFDFFCEGIAINTIAFSAEKGYDIEYIGDPIECSLIRFLKHLNVGYSILRNNLMRPIIDSSSYSPDNKISFTILEMDEKRDFVRLYVKGTPEALIDLISVYIGEGQVIEMISPKHYEKIRKNSINIMKEGAIPMLFCYRDIPRDHYNQTRHAYLQKDTQFMQNIIRQLTFICLVGVKDELREDVEKDIMDCQRAGVMVRMVTSQNRESARIAAEKCGIIKHIPDLHLQNIIHIRNRSQEKVNEDSSSSSKKKINFSNYEIIDAQEDLRKLIDMTFMKKNQNSFCSFEFTILDLNKFNKSLENALVISRAHARDKFILVASLKQSGSTVAITGDGVSDSLAMKTAHVGISMGYHSSDMSKEAADVILTDDNFKSIITAIVYGRNIFATVRKFLQFQITATMVVVILVLISAFPTINFYFYPNQLLWINLILDTLTAICMSSEQPDREVLLSKRPDTLKRSIFTSDMKLKILIQTILQLILLLILIFAAPILFDIENDMGVNYRVWTDENGVHTTIIFNCVVFMQFFNAFISRTLSKDDMNVFRNISSNKIFLIVEPMIILLQLLVISHGGRLTRTRPLDFSWHLYCFIYSSLVMLTLPILKYIPFKNLDFNDLNVDSEQNK